MCRAALHMLDGGIPGADQPFLQGQPGPQSQPVGQGALLPCVICCNIATLVCIAHDRATESLLGCSDAAEACNLGQQGVLCACIARQAGNFAWYPGHVNLSDIWIGLNRCTM